VYILVFLHQNVGEIRSKELENRSFENVSHSTNLGTAVTNQYLSEE
jgi:hypothetical protein